MGDLADGFRAMTNFGRKRKADEREKNILVIEEELKGHRIEYLTAYQFRVDGFLDLFPTQRRFHNLDTGQRGTYPRSGLDRFVEEQKERL